MKIITKIIDVTQGKCELKHNRSGKWSEVRAKHLKEFPTCAVCGGVKSLQVHHKQPFSKFPTLELDVNNLITLCESDKGGVNCHLFFGHLGNFRSYNPNVVEDTEVWVEKLKNKPA